MLRTMGQIWMKEVKLNIMLDIKAIRYSIKNSIWPSMMLDTWSPSCSSECNFKNLREGGKGYDINHSSASTSAGHEEIVSWQGGESSSKEKLLKEQSTVYSRMKRVPLGETNLGYLVKMKRIQPEKKRNLEYLANWILLRGIFGLFLLLLARQPVAVLLPELSSVNCYKIEQL